MGKRRGNMHTRLAALEGAGEVARAEDRPRVVVYLPRKDGDIRPLGVCSQAGNVLSVSYDPAQTDPVNWQSPNVK